MKWQISIQVWLCIMVLAGTMGCEGDETVKPRQNAASAIAGQFSLADDHLSSVWQGRLVDGAGKRGSGSVFEANEYGSWQVVSEQDSLNGLVRCGRGWFIQECWAWVGLANALPFDGEGAGLLDRFVWNDKLSHVQSLYEWQMPAPKVEVDKEWAMMVCLDLTEIDFLGSPFHPTRVWAEGTITQEVNGRQIVSLRHAPFDSAIAEAKTHTHLKNQNR